MKKIRVLIAEDESTLARILKDTLETMEFEVVLAADGKEGLTMFRKHKPDILVCDVMMPLMSGFDMVRQIRLTDKTTPILMLTAKTAVGDVVEGFGAGADDYLRKPFAMPELVVRIRSLANRMVNLQLDDVEELAIGNFTLNVNDNSLRNVITGTSVMLPNREAEILKVLCRNRNAIVPTKRLLIDLWGEDDFFNARSLQVQITRLRHRLNADPSISILNVRGEGYRLVTVRPSNSD